MEKLDILPQTIFKFKCDEELTASTLNRLTKEEWIIEQSNIKFTTKNNQLHKDSDYKKFYKWIHKCLKTVKDEIGLSCEELKITQSWGNREEYKQWHHPHVHSNSIVSGIFYLTNSNAHTWFSIKSIWSNSDNGLYEVFKMTTNEQNQVIHKQKTVAGELIIFPSSLFHSVDEHMMQDSPRYTISFNSFPCGKIGYHNLLMGLEIDIK